MLPDSLGHSDQYTSVSEYRLRREHFQQYAMQATQPWYSGFQATASQLAERSSEVHTTNNHSVTHHTLVFALLLSVTNTNDQQASTTISSLSLSRHSIMYGKQIETFSKFAGTPSRIRQRFESNQTEFF